MKKIPEIQIPRRNEILHVNKGARWQSLLNMNRARVVGVGTILADILMALLTALVVVMLMANAILAVLHLYYITS